MAREALAWRRLAVRNLFIVSPPKDPTIVCAPAHRQPPDTPRLKGYRSTSPSRVYTRDKRMPLLYATCRQRLHRGRLQAIGPASADVTLWYFFIGFWILTKRFIYEPLIRKTLQNEKIREKLIFV